mmetsp:Transcript_34444/g.103878  ORF Transcript_34444/g.103878 Transcript_34444/m.103878 type:complete len:741 (+) Transcript_34444:3-2225(+)
MVLEQGNDVARTLRFRGWADADRLAAKCGNLEYLVKCRPLAAPQVLEVHKRLLGAGVKAEHVSIDDDRSLLICCVDDMQARMVMALDGLRTTDGGELKLTRGDGDLLPMDQLPSLFVQPVGKIVAVKRRDPHRTFCGLLRPFNKGSALFVSKDHRVPRIICPHGSCPADYAEDPSQFAEVLVAAKITEWPLQGSYANGEVTAVVGEVGDVKAEVKVILTENGVDDSDFPPEVLETLPPLDANGEWHIPKEEIAARRDLRDTCIFTIDPATARDLDDALSFNCLEGGGYEVGVHIADVTFFLKPETDLYDIASERATSTYLVNKCYPMLPRLLCENLCSLAENEDRLAFSVIWKFDDKGKVVSEWFGRTVIRSCVKLAYERAQAVIEDPELDWAAADHPPIHNGQDVDTVKGSILGLHKLARSLREKRFRAGAIRLDKTKVSFRLNKETGRPVGCSNYTQRDSNKLVEEFMLLANMAVARKIHSHFPELAMLRRHPPPKDNKLGEVVEVCRRMGYDFHGGSSGELHRSLQKLGETMDEVQFRTVQLLCMGPMQMALYVCTGTLERVEDARHYALAVPFYTHFTSPIRRMADVVVHHLLDATLTGAKPWYNEDEVERQARICNERKDAAKVAQEASEYLFMCMYVDDNGPILEQASVCKVQDRSFDVLTLKLGVETRVNLDRVQDLEMHTFDRASKSLELLWKDGRRQEVGLLSKVSVSLAVKKDGAKRDIVATLLPPEAAR